MSNVCLKCSALKWKGENPGICCSSGKVKLPPILKPPEPLCSLLKGETAQSKDFMKHIRLFNNMFAMTSFKSNVVLNNGWTPTFKVKGQVYDPAGPLHPANAENSKYLQIYFLGEDEQVQRRLDLLDSPVDRNIVLKLQRMLHQHNSYVRSFKMAAEIMDDNTQVDYRIKISGKAPLKEHKGRFNAPSVNEVAIMVAGEIGDRRDIVLHSRSCLQMPLQRIQDTHRSYDPLQYPLLFVRGEDGYDLNIKDVNKATSNDYAYRMMQRISECNTLLRCPHLFQQYIVDMYVKVKNERLRFIRLNQTKLRAEDYGVLSEAVRNGNNVTSENLSKLMVLPSSFTGGPR
ncbi:ATP-dependent DNA helicase [Trichonephila clavipes]|nr:ATP-dependent DNA helicase [Trichonephila clavipes]